MAERNSADRPRMGAVGRRLAAIMFTDLVGYSALAHRNEALAIELLELHRAMVRDVLARHGGIEIDTVGDAFLVEFSGALAAVECAVVIQAAFSDYNATAPQDRRMQLRIGIHAGDVEHKDGKVMGDGVNIASRIHDMAEPGGICVSDDVRHAVRSHGFSFLSLGAPALKNIASRIELFTLHAALPRGLARARAGLRRARLAIGALAVAGILAAATVGVWRAGGFAPSPALDKSVAVLPFENLSSEKDSAYFTDGLHDTVIGHLARISSLKVISRTSVMRYAGKRPDLREVARELGVAHVLEGSVLRAGGRLRVATQLIEADTDSHVWSQEYERDLADVFAVQADIARSVAIAVDARLTPEELAGIEAVPTTSQAAYDLYLRALMIDSNLIVVSQEPVREAIGLLDHAIALDPGFALAYALRSHLHDHLYWWGHDFSDHRRRLVGESADRALELAPLLAEAHLAKAFFHYHGFRNYEAAIAEFETGRRFAPGSAWAHVGIAAVYRRQGQWPEATEAFERAVTLDPLHAVRHVQLGEVLREQRRYAAAAAVYARAARLAPEDPMPLVEIAFTRFLLDGDLHALDRAMRDVPADASCHVAYARGWVSLLQRRYSEAMAAVDLCEHGYFVVGGGDRISKAFKMAQIQWHASGRKGAAAATVARVELEKLLEGRPDLSRTRMALAEVLVMLGEREQALREVDRALASMPLSNDAQIGAQLLYQAAAVHAIAGSEERALDELEQALRLPAGAHAHDARLNPAFDVLRRNGRFERMIAERLPLPGSGDA